MKTTTSHVLLAGLAFALGHSLSLAAHADSLPLPDYKPVPSGIAARILPVDAKKGYLVKQLKPNVYLITDGGY